MAGGRYYPAMRRILFGRHQFGLLLLFRGAAAVAVDRHRPVAVHGSAAQVPALDAEVGDGAVLGGAIVPDGDVARAPAPAYRVLRLGDVVLQIGRAHV